ncbi:MAG: leucine-rich repeat domain-containing protein [Pseudoflavonifractor sp.]|nr:leucine-rich repeat domain-containing protein [Pseudoflavonifractor sp.]
MKRFLFALSAVIAFLPCLAKVTTPLVVYFTTGDYKYTIYYKYMAGTDIKVYDMYVGLDVADGAILEGDIDIPREVEFEGEMRTVLTIKDQAFMNQTKITSVSIGPEVNYVSPNAFEGCSSMKSINIPPQLTVMPNFAGCESLTDITFDSDEGYTSSDSPNNTMWIPYENFKDCPIKNVIINRDIAVDGFDKTRRLFPDAKNIVISERIETIPAGLYNMRNDLEKFTIPKHIRTVSDYCFYGCSSLKDVDFGMVEHIGAGAFEGCPLTETLTIPGYVQTIGESAFSDCANVNRLVLESMEYELNDYLDNNLPMCDMFGNTGIRTAYINRDFSNLSNSYVKMFPNLETVVFGDKVTVMQSNLLLGSKVTDVTLSPNTREIKSGSLSDLIEVLRIPSSVVEVADNAMSIRSLRELIFEDGAQPIRIGCIPYPRPVSGMFSVCKNLTRVYIGRDIKYDRYVSPSTPDAVQSQQLYSPFRNMNHLLKVFVSPSVTWMDPDMFVDDVYTSGSCVQRIALPEGVTLNSSTQIVTYPRDALIMDGPVIYSPDLSTLYWIDDRMEGELTLPSNLRHVVDNAAYLCTGIELTGLPSNLESVGKNGFGLCYSTKLGHVELPLTLKTVGESAFEGVGIETLVVNEGLESAGSRAFYNANNLVYKAVNAVNLTYNGNNTDEIFHPRSIIISEGVESLPAGFAKHSEISRVEFPSTLVEIGEDAFSNTYLESVTIPSNVVKIGKNAFAGCSRVKLINIEATTADLMGVTDMFDSKTSPLRVSIGRNYVSENGNVLKIYNKAPSSLYVGPNVTKLYPVNGILPMKTVWDTAKLPANYIGYTGTYMNYTRSDNMLAGATALRWLSSMFESEGIYYVLTSTSTATAIDSSYDSDISDMSLPKTVQGPRGEVSVESVMPYVFAGNKVMKNLVIDFDGDINQFSFLNCENLTSLTSNGNIGNVGASAFSGCKSLERVDFAGGCEQVGSSAFQNCTYLKSVNLEGATKIGSSAFMNCSSLTHVLLSNGLKRIDNNAFQYCSSLESQNLPATVEYIGPYAFSMCSALTEINIPQNLTDLSEAVFQNCPITSVTFPANLGSVSPSTFSGCTELKNVVILERDKQLEFKTISNSSSVTFGACPLDKVEIYGDIAYAVGKSPFLGNQSLATAKIGGVVSKIPESLFKNCSSLSEVSIADCITAVEQCAFESCIALESVEIGIGVESLGQSVFKGCRSLSEASIGISLKSIGKDAFMDTNLSRLTSKNEEPPVCEPYALTGIDTFNCTLEVPVQSVDRYRNAPQWEDFFDIVGVDMKTLVTDVEKAHPGIRMLTNGILVKDMVGTQIEVFSIDGILINSLIIGSENEFISLMSGIYIIKTQSTSSVVKI